MIRRRSVVVIILLFGGAILVLAYSGVVSSRNNMLQLLTHEGHSHLQSLITSAQNNVAASAIVEEATNERLVDNARLLGALIEQNRYYLDSLDVLERRYHLDRIDLVDAEGGIQASSWKEAIGVSIFVENALPAALDSVMRGKRNISVSIPMPSALPGDEIVAVALKTDAGVILLRAQTKRLTDYQASLGIGYLVRQLGSQKGINYVVLQSDSGIVLASRAIGPIAAIVADSFLNEATTHEQIVSRITDFEGEQVLEVVRSFKSDALPSGLFRLGISLESYHQLYNDSLTQLAILSAVIFILGIVGSYAAVSTRKLMKTTSSLEQLRSITDEIVESVEAAIIATDRNGKITMFNAQAQELFSLSAKGVVGKSYRNLFPDDKLFLAQIESRSRQVIREEKVYELSPNKNRHLLISSAPIHSPDGKFAGAVSLIYDLTEMKALEEHARRSERLSELGNLAAGVAHEIRNPLNAIAIASQRIRSEFTPQKDNQEYDVLLKTITDEVNRLNLIVNDFLALARGGKVNKVLVDLTEYLDKIVSLVRFEAEEKRITISVNVDDGLKANIDTQQMKKVILNLLKNAVEATSSPGSVTVRATLTDDNKADIRVSNSGKPIPEDIRQKIFQPYFTTKPEGTGLGLAICHRIVGDHGGRLELMDGEPTTFRVIV